MDQPIKDYIEESLVNHYAKCSMDRYSQMSVIDVYTVFKQRTKEALAFIQEQKDYVDVATYGDRYGTYKGINPTGGIKDAQLKERCAKAMSTNPARNNQNQW